MSPANGNGEVAVLERETTHGHPSGKSSGKRRSRRGSRMRRFLRENGLSVAAFGIFLICLVGQAVSGLYEYNQEQREHGQRTVGAAQYVRSGHFVEATFENWESE